MAAAASTLVSGAPQVVIVGARAAAGADSTAVDSPQFVLNLSQAFLYEQAVVDGIGAALGEVGAACGGCHKPFRAEKN